jgi:hypothetical protein
MKDEERNIPRAKIQIRSLSGPSARQDSSTFRSDQGKVEGLLRLRIERLTRLSGYFLAIASRGLFLQANRLSSSHAPQLSGEAL